MSTSNSSWLKTEERGGAKSLTLSVIVPVYNSIHQLESCLEALAAAHGADFDVIVVDDGSTQPLEQLVRRFGFNYMRIDGPGGPARARNRGVAETTGTHLVFIDADVCVHPDTLLRMTEAFASDPAIDAVVGTYDDAPADPGFLSQYKNLFHHFVHQNSAGPIPIFWSGCGAMRRDVFVKFGGFDEQRYRRPAIEDIELGTWMSAAGHQIVLDNRIRCKHLKRWTLRSLLKTDIFDRGIPWTRLMLRARHMPSNLNTRSNQLLSVALVYLTLLSLLIGYQTPLGWVWPILGVAGVTALNWDFYRFFISRRGWWFALRTVPMHWLYFIYCGFCFAAGTALHLLTRNKISSLLVLFLTGLTLVLYGRGITNSSGFAGDALHHLMNGIFIHDALQNFMQAASGPREYAFEYYRHYPAVNLGYYPPVFHAIEAAFMLVLGVSPTIAQIAVLFMALLLTYFSFVWFRLYFDAFWSAGATSVLVSTPLLVFWGQDIMLEIPVLAWMIGAMWAFERVLRCSRPNWREAMIWAVLTSLAIWTKQHALILLGIFTISAIASGRWRHLRNEPALAATAIIVGAATTLIAISFYLGGDAVKHSVGTQASIASRLNAEQWTFYLLRLPEVIGWPTLALAALGLAMLVAKRHQYAWPMLAWLVLFYVMHSYFLAQTTRYACLWVPPFCWLATFALRSSTQRVVNQSFSVGGALMAVFVIAAVVRGATVDVPAVPTAYQRAADDLIETMPPFSCLTFMRDRPGRMAACYRLAVEGQKSEHKDLYSFGHIWRADQVLRDWKQHWPDAAALARALRQWNMAYFLIELPRPVRTRNEIEVNQAIEGLLGLGELREYRRYSVVYRENARPARTLILYQWITPIAFSRESMPTIQTWRIPTTIRPSPATH